MWSPTSRVDRRKAEFENLQLGKANINSISSCYRSHHRAFSCLIRLSWNRSENARIRSLSSALAPIIILLNLKQNFFFSLSGQMRHESIEFILAYEAFLVALQERCTTYHMTQSTTLFGKSYPTETQNSLSLTIDSIRRASKFSVVSEQVHSSWSESGQASSRARVFLGLEPKNTQRFWNHSKNLFKKRAIRIQGFLDERNDRVITNANAMLEYARQYYSEAFRENDTPSQNQEVAEFKQHLEERLAELPSKPCLFTINDLHLSFRRLKSIPISHYGFLLQTFTALLIENTYPQHWKLSKMVFLPKKKTVILSVNRTRPISLLPCLGKVYERCFLVYLRQWMKDNATIPPEQLGFGEHHSRTTRFVQFLQHISTGLLQQTTSLVIYVDFTKAFDQLWHDGLLYKLHRMNCPQERVIFIIEYLKNRKRYIETQKHMCRTDPISSLSLWNSSTNSFSHLFPSICGWPCTDHPCLSMVASIGIRIANGTNRPASIESSPSLRRRVETDDQLPQDQWQWIHRRVVIPTLSLSRSVNIPSRKQPCTNTLATTLMNDSRSVNIARGCSQKSKRTLLSSNTSLDRKHHQWERENSSLKRSFELGGTQPMMKYGGYQTTKQQNRKHNASSGDSLIKLKRSHLNCSKTAFSAKPCLCISECTSTKKRSSMLYLAEDSTDIFVSGWTLVWQKDENAIWIVYRTCWTKNTKNELRKERERDWKPGLIVDFPIIMISDQIKHSHTHNSRSGASCT